MDWNEILRKGVDSAWAALCIYWLWSARDLKATRRAEPLIKRLLVYWTPLAAAFFLLGPGEWFGESLLRRQFVPHSRPVFLAAFGLAWAGVLYACWARRTLGRNWSSVVKLQHDHELVATGPYRRVRHPIYTGLLCALLGTALKVGDWRGLLAVAIVLASFWHKLRQEERWLGEHFGAAYAAYRKTTAVLIPGLL